MPLDRAMKPLFAFVLLCAPVFGADSGIQVVSTTTKNTETVSISTQDVFTRDGKTDLVRGTKTKAGEIQIRTHRFYHAGSLVGIFSAMPNSSGFTSEASSSYSMGLDFDASKNVKSAAIRTKDGVMLDIFTCKNGVFSPVENSVLQKANAFGADMKRLFDPEHVDKISPERFGQEAQELIEKHKGK